MNHRRSNSKLTFVGCLFVAGYLLFLLGCSKNNDTEPSGLNTDIFVSLFMNFSPVYNFINEETVMLGHAARVSADGYTPWNGFSGTQDSLGLSDINWNSVFRAGSVTKMFTAVIILQLWEEGKIDLDTPFNNYLELDLENYPKIDEFSDMTIRHLLSHRSGLPYISSTTFFDVYDYTDPITQLDRMHFLFTEGEPEFEPGTQYAYRNSNFNVLGLVIERITDNDYHKVLQDNIYNRIGLQNTHLMDYDIQSTDPRFAKGYTDTFDGTLYHGSQSWAAGGLVSTVNDLTEFMGALVKGDLFEKTSTFDLMVEPVEGSYYGLGVFVRETPEGMAYGHGGGIFGYNTRLEYFPDVQATVASTMSFNGYDFIVVNWYDDFCYPVIREIQRARYQSN